MGIMQAFIGGTYGDGVKLTSVNVQDFVIDPANASAAYDLTNAGDVNGITTTLGTQFIETWLNVPANVGLYECRITPTIGTFSSGSSTGVWLPMTSSYTWVVTQNVIGNKACTFTAEIRDIANSITLAAASITVEADVS